MSIDIKGKWVLITGASSGLGEEMSIQLSRDYHANLVIVARREERLKKLQYDLDKQYQNQVHYVVADLSKPEDIDRLLQIVTIDYSLAGAVLNAGVTYFGKNLDISTDQVTSIIDTNVRSVVTLSNQLIRHYNQTENTFSLLLISSMAAFFPVPYQAIYSASKAFILAYANAFTKELDNDKISISVFAPGGIKTEMTSTKEFSGLQKWLMPVDQAAKEAIRALIKRKYISIPGWSNRVGARFMRLLPRGFLTGKMAGIYKKSLDK